MRTLLAKIRKFSEPCPRPEVCLETHTTRGWITFHFIVDTGADFCAFPANLAEEYGVGKFKPENPVAIRMLAGETHGYKGTITLRIDGVESTWTCFFTIPAADSTAPKTDGVPGKRHLNPATYEGWEKAVLGLGNLRLPVIGRAGFLQEYSMCLDDEELAIRRHNWIRRLLRRCRRFIQRDD